MTVDLAIPAPEVVERLECAGWTIVPAGRHGVLSLNSGHFFADGTGVSVLMRHTGREVLVSDGGMMRIRLADAGLDLDGERAKAGWTTTLDDFGLEEIDTRVVGRRPADRVVLLLHDLVDAMLTLDGLRALARPAQGSRLEKQLYQFLAEAVRLPYQQHPTVRLPGGLALRPTAKVTAPGRDVFMQIVTTAEGVSRAIYVAKGLQQVDIGASQRLMVFKGYRREWSSDHIAMLTGDARVGFMAERSELRQILVDV